VVVVVWALLVEDHVAVRHVVSVALFLHGLAAGLVLGGAHDLAGAVAVLDQLVGAHADPDRLRHDHVLHQAGLVELLLAFNHLPRGTIT